MSSISIRSPSPAVVGPDPTSDFNTTPTMDLEVEESAILSGNLPPVDAGWKAWRFLVAMFMIEALVWGLPQSYGVFREYYLEHAGFTSSGVTIVGTLSPGIMYMMAFVSFPMVARYPRQRQLTQWIGLAVFCLGCVLASFSTRVWHLILTQGLLCGLGAHAIYAPGLVMINEWWVEKRGFAMGFVYCGTAVAGVIVPLLCSWLLDQYGFRKTLRIYAIIMFSMTSLSIPFVHGRLPIPVQNPPRPRGSNLYVSLQLRMFKSPMFILLALANVMQALGHFVPPLYLPSFAHDLSLSSAKATSLVSVLNAATVIGRLGSGYMSDKLDLCVPIFLSSAGSGVATLAIWGLSDGYPALLAFSIVFGCWSGGWSVLWSRFCTAIVRDERATNEQRNEDRQRHAWNQGEEADAIAGIYGSFSLGRGLGNVFTGPISSKLLIVSGASARKGMYGLQRYEALVVMTGAIMMGSGLVAFGGRFWRKASNVGWILKKAVGKSL